MISAWVHPEVEEYALALFFKVHVKVGGAAMLRALKNVLLTGKTANHKTKLGGAEENSKFYWLQNATLTRERASQSQARFGKLGKKF